MRKCYKWLVPAFLFVSLACAVFGLVTNAKYVHEKQGATVTLTINYQQNYLAPKSSLPDFSATNATKLVFTTLDRLSTYNIAYDELTNQADAGYDDVTATTTSAIRYGYDATEKTGYFISMTNRPIVPYSCAKLFSGNAKLKTIDFGDTVTVGTDEEGNEIKVPLFDTSSATDMGGMFSSCTSLTSLDLSNFDTSKVESIRMMFMYCTLSSLDLNNFDTSNVTNMNQVFYYCSNLATLDLSGWNTSNVTDMTYMFSSCTSLASLNVSNFDTSNVTNMENMFYDCRSLTSLDLSNFKVRNAYNTQKMFLSCSNLQTIFVSSDWSLSGATTNMFQGCTALVGGEGTTYDENHVDKAYAVIDNGTERPGYFTGISLNSDAFHTLADSIKHITFGKASNHADVVKNTNAVVTPLGSAGSSSSYAVSGYTVTENGEATLYVLSEYAPIVAPADCTSLIGNSLDGRVVTFEREDLSDATSCAWFDTSKVTNMTKMFSDGTSGNQNSITINGLDTFDTSKVTDMQYMFCGDGNLQPIDLSAFDTSNVTDMQFMFYNCSSLTSIGDISGWDVSGVTNMQRMFNGCSALPAVSLSQWNVSKVENMENMFFGCSKLTSLDFSAWDVSSVTVMSYMFYNCSSLTEVSLSQWDVSKVQKMNRMFAGCSALTSLDLSAWDTSSVADISNMFWTCSDLTSLNVSSWNTSNVKNMSKLFYDCKALTELNLLGWSTSGVNNMQYMFNGCSSLTTIYVGDGWTANVSDNNSSGMFGECSNLVGGAGTKYSSSNIGKTYAVIDGLNGKPGYLTGPSFNKEAFTSLAERANYIVFGKTSNHAEVVENADAVVTPLALAGTDSSNVISGYAVTENGKTTLYVLSGAPIVAPADCSSLFGSSSVMATAITFEREDLSDATSRAWFDTSKVTDMSRMFYNDWDENSWPLEEINGLDTFNTSLVTDMSYMFYGTSYMQSLDVSSFDTSKVTNMQYMFTYYGMDYAIENAVNGENATVALDVSAFNTSNVTDMSYTFRGCCGLASLSLSGWDTSNVTTMQSMFDGCSALETLSLSSWNTSNVTTMDYMFYGCSKLTSDVGISGWDVSKVDNMLAMFYGCSKLTSDVGISGWDVSKVDNMMAMFYNCKAFTKLDLSAWDTSNVTDMRKMFYQCEQLTAIIVGDSWSTRSVTQSSDMFIGCTALVGGEGTKFDSMYTDKTYAVIDGQNGQKGYLTFAGTLNTVDVHSLLAEHTEINSVVFGSATAHDVTGAEATPVSFAGNAVNCYLVGSTAYFLSAQPIVVWYDASNLFKELTGIQTITFESVNGTAWFDTSRVTNMKGMFEAQQNGDSFTSSITAINGLDTFNTSKVTDMTNMFRHCESLAGALDLSSWDTSNVTDMQHMFDGLCSVSSITFGQKFSTSKVTDMNHMFNACGTLTSLDLSMFDTSNVKSMFAMFNMCVELQSITFGTNFKTAEVTSMGYMFAGDLKLAQLDLLTFETANVTDMKHMFHDCSTVTVLDLSAFNTVKVTDMTSMFNSCSALRTIYVGDGWTTANAVTTDMFYNCTAVVGGSGTTYSADHTDGGYARVDGAMKNDGEDAVLLSDFEYCGTPGYLTAKNAMPSGSVLNALLKANLPATVTNLVIGSIGGGYDVADASAVSADGITLYIKGDTAYLLTENRIKANPNLSCLFADLFQIKKITFEKYGENELWFDTSEVVSMYMMFNGLTELQEVENLGLLNTSKVQNMHNMFYNCGSLSNIGDVKSWDVSNVVTMISMFSWNSDDWSKQNRPSVWTALDLSSWNTANIRSIYHMFAGCYTLTEINLTGWKTEDVSNMAFLFYDCKALTTIKGLETWDTSNVITMQQTFDICNSVVTLDLSGWNTANVTDMRWMFSNCNSLTTIYVGDGWNTDNVPTDKDGEDMSRQMFGWCNVLNANCNQQNSDANNDYVNKTYAHFGEGGYLTYKSASQA